MSFEIKITGSTPLEALSLLASAGNYCMHIPAVTEAAKNILDSEGSAMKPGPHSGSHSPIPATSAAAPQPMNSTAAPQTPAPVITPAEAFRPVNQTTVSAGASVNPPMPGTGQNSMMTSQTSLFNQQPSAAPVPGCAPAASIPTQVSGQYPQPAASTTPMGPPPLSNAPGFTVPQISKAGADLVTANPARMSDLNALLQKYGVQSLSELKPNQVGAVAMELRGLGANI